MKKYLNYVGFLGILALSLGFTACSSDDDDNNNNGGTETTEKYVWTTDGGLKACDHILFTNGEEDASGTEIGNGDQEFVFTGKQELAQGTYLLKGWVYVADGAQLTIDAGTIVKGDKETKAAIIVEPGGKLIAKGTASAPIVFTSEQSKGNRKPGDWGGIILCGKAPNNNGEMNQQIEGGPRTKHGGSDASDNSGVLQYVRIEFAGYPFQTDKEINGLTMGSVGSGTTIDHVQVSYSNDDSFEWFGGTVNCKYLIAYKGWDDDFDTDNGFSGNVQFGLSIRDSKIADASQSNGFESDNNASGTTATPLTNCKFSNITFIGPKAVDASFQNTSDYINAGSVNPNNGSSLGKFQSAMHLRRNTALCVYNSVAIGWPIGLIIDNQKGDARSNAENGLLQVNNVYYIGMDVQASDFNKQYNDILCTNYSNADGKQEYDESQVSWTHSWMNTQSTIKVLDSFSGMINTTVPYRPTSSAPWLTGASFSGLSGFETVAYCGAFGSDDWTSGWTNFDPENADY